MFNKMKSSFFWQPKNDYLRWFQKNSFRKKTLIILNYIIWVFFFYISFLLIRHDINIFWQILFATIIAEIIERFVKSKVSWCRPMFKHKDKTPVGLVDSWYKTGSFPSGHTIKATYFFLFLLQYGIFSPILFLCLIAPLLFFRVLVSFHYPIDMLGGILIGSIVWLSSKGIVLPQNLTNIIQTIFNFVFLIK
jgi:membrane-associated phospholipid phosphatase